MLLDIIKYPDPLLREVSKPVDLAEVQTPEFQALIANMFETMYSAPGIGLASVQVGVLKRFMVLDLGISEGEVIERDPRIILNPEFIHRSGSIVWEEGCLSCPDIVVPVKRFQEIEIEYFNEKGLRESLKADDLLAVAIQHEIDHMDGKLILDQLSRLKRQRYTEKIHKGKIAIR